MSDWTKTKPKVPGVYKVRGFNVGRLPSKQREAVVEVRRVAGVLRCNLHDLNSSDAPPGTWTPVSRYDPAFQWYGPLTTQPE